MRALITGASGFAGRHLAARCAAAGDEVVPRVSRGRRASTCSTPRRRARAVARARPDVVYHLAARAHVGRSWEDPAGVCATTSRSRCNLLEAVRAEAPDAAVVAVGSGEVYGPPAALPVDEDAPLRPQNPYAVSKAAGDLLAGFYADAHGLRRDPRARRSTTPGPARSHATRSPPSPARSPAAARRDPVAVVTGNPDTRRDYTDVRDVVRAYRLLAERGRARRLQRLLGPHGLGRASWSRRWRAPAGLAVEHGSIRRSCARTR